MIRGKKIGNPFKSSFRKISSRVKGLQSRRPHRSLYLSNTSTSKRGLKIPGYFAFSGNVFRTIWKNRWLFTKFLVLYGALSGLIIGLMSQENFAAFRDALSDASVDGFTKWSALLSNAIGSASSTTLDTSQQALAVMLFLYGWLTLIWLLRRLMANDNAKPKLRDGLYSSGSPVIAMFVVVIIILLQLLPLAIVFLSYVSVTAAGWINSGIAIENMAAWCAMMIAAIATLYWVCSSFIALVVVTLPGMYPMQAIRAAGDLVLGRRLKLVLRLLFMMLPVALLWIMILVPAILVDSWLKLSWQPLVPIIVLALSTITLIWCTTYIYMLYRHFVDDPTPPVKPISKKDTVVSQKFKAKSKPKKKTEK